jgi:hypothetical protein
MRFPTICDACEHCHTAAEDAREDAPPTCDAFLDGIPDKIWSGGFDHRAAYPGDAGVRFEQKPGWEDILKQWEEERG